MDRGAYANVRFQLDEHHGVPVRGERGAKSPSVVGGTLARAWAQPLHCTTGADSPVSRSVGCVRHARKSDDAGVAPGPKPVRPAYWKELDESYLPPSYYAFEDEKGEMGSVHEVVTRAQAQGTVDGHPIRRPSHDDGAVQTVQNAHYVPCAPCALSAPVGLVVQLGTKVHNRSYADDDGTVPAPGDPVGAWNARDEENFLDEPMAAALMVVVPFRPDRPWDPWANLEEDQLAAERKVMDLYWTSEPKPYALHSPLHVPRGRVAPGRQPSLRADCEVALEIVYESGIVGHEHVSWPMLWEA